MKTSCTIGLTLYLLASSNIAICDEGDSLIKKDKLTIDGELFANFEVHECKIESLYQGKGTHVIYTLGANNQLLDIEAHMNHEGFYFEWKLLYLTDQKECAVQVKKWKVLEQSKDGIVPLSSTLLDVRNWKIIPEKNQELDENSYNKLYILLMHSIGEDLKNSGISQ
ncbi:hypothetical protein Rhal01_03828 [Rubritalea halochordaticola]|uniref:Uncharacterized protein n=1 Tax=Rubritalea halochordaticola TaxID=714537 RepID=A0ABP9VAH5_9BACT